MLMYEWALAILFCLYVSILASSIPPVPPYFINIDLQCLINFINIFSVCALLLPEPTYSGPENITYFRTVAGLDEELERDKKVAWVITFYTAWNPACVNFAPVFAQLSNE